MPSRVPRITVIGGGLAGSEAAWQLAEQGWRVDLYEMRPVVSTPAHRTPYCAELVCSNSFRSQDLANAAGLLKEELRRVGSLIIRMADRYAVPAGGALGVDRELFARAVTRALESHPNIRIHRMEVTDIPDADAVLIATGPLTSERLTEAIRRLTGIAHLHFYDAVSPIVEADSIDMRYAFRGSRYGRGGDDYINCPMDENTYRRFWEALCQAERYPLKDFERIEELRFFEGCLPIEEMARRGYETLLYGPLKPVGLIDPRTGREPFAVVQLRQDNIAATLYSMVGFQTTLRIPEQQRVFRMIPALHDAVFVRYGMVHRNTFICSPRLLNTAYQLRADPRIFFAGQITGVEGYIESTASGFVAAIAMACWLRQIPWEPPPRTTAMGALAYYISHADAAHFQPMNINWGIIEPWPGRERDRRTRRLRMAHRALSDLDRWWTRMQQRLGIAVRTTSLRLSGRR